MPLGESAIERAPGIWSETTAMENPGCRWRLAMGSRDSWCGAAAAPQATPTAAAASAAAMATAVLFRFRPDTLHLLSPRPAGRGPPRRQSTLAGALRLHCRVMNLSPELVADILVRQGYVGREQGDAIRQEAKL